jgi:hypothetical protein
MYLYEFEGIRGPPSSAHFNLVPLIRAKASKFGVNNPILFRMRSFSLYYLILYRVFKALNACSRAESNIRSIVSIKDIPL